MRNATACAPQLVLPWPPAPSTPTNLVVMNVAQELPPLTLDVLQPQAVEPQDEHSSSWRRVLAQASRSGVLRVVILGASPTTGCGAADFGNASRLCSTRLSWGRQMHDALTRSLSGVTGLALRTETRIYARNAVRTDFFATCTREMVPRESSVVLLETGTNLWGTTDEENEQQLTATAAAIRRAAPSAVLVFVVWPHNEFRKRVAGPALVRRVAEKHNIEAVWVLDGPLPPWPKAVEAAPCDSGRDWRCAPRCCLYGQEGRDLVHPNARGHALMAQRAAGLLASRVLAAWCADDDGAAASATPRAPRAAEHGGASNDEVCYPTADVLPRPRDAAAASSSSSSSWELRDEARGTRLPCAARMCRPVRPAPALRAPLTARPPLGRAPSTRGCASWGSSRRASARCCSWRCGRAWGRAWRWAVPRCP